MAEDKPLKPVYYIYGDDYLVEEAVSGLMERALTPGFESMNRHDFDGRTLDAAEVVSAAMTMPAFSPARFILVSRAGAVKKEAAGVLCAYLSEPSPTTCLVFTADTKKPATGSPLIKAVKGTGSIVACNRLKGAQLIGWIRKRAREQGKEMDGAAAQRLVQTAGDRLRDLSGEIDKLVLFVGEKASIGVSDVEDAGCDIREESVFALTDAIGSRDVSAALEGIAGLSSEPHLMVLGAIARQMRILLKLKARLGRGERGPKLAGAVGVPPYFLDKYVSMSSRFTYEDLARAMERLRAVDIELKTGAAPVLVAMSRLVMELCAV